MTKLTKLIAVTITSKKTVASRTRWKAGKGAATVAAEVAAVAATKVETDDSNRQSKAKRSSSMIEAVIAAKDLSYS